MTRLPLLAIGGWLLPVGASAGPRVTQHACLGDPEGGEAACPKMGSAQLQMRATAREAVAGEEKGADFHAFLMKAGLAWAGLSKEPRPLIRGGPPLVTVRTVFMPAWESDKFGLYSSNTPRGPAIGGGPGYTGGVPKSAASAVVTSEAELFEAVRHSKEGDVIFIEAESIVLTSPLHLMRKVTLAGDRGEKGSPGPLLDFSQLRGGSALGDGSMMGMELDLLERSPTVVGIFGHMELRLTGLRLKGPLLEEADEPSVAVLLTRPSEVDNCEIFAWHAGVQVQHWMPGDETKQSLVSHCHIHNTDSSQLGHGVMAQVGAAKVQMSQFEQNGVAVGSGFSGADRGFDAASHSWELEMCVVFKEDKTAPLLARS